MTSFNKGDLVELHPVDPPGPVMHMNAAYKRAYKHIPYVYKILNLNGHRNLITARGWDKDRQRYIGNHYYYLPLKDLKHHNRKPINLEDFL